MEAETCSEMREIVDAYHVAVVTRDEDARLRSARLNCAMPPGWEWRKDPFARWKLVGIEVPSMHPCRNIQKPGKANTGH